MSVYSSRRLPRYPSDYYLHHHYEAVPTIREGSLYSTREGNTLTREGGTFSRNSALPSGGSRNNEKFVPKVLDVIGCHREITLCGHVDLIRRLPIRQREHLSLIDKYMAEPGNYEGKYSDYYDSAAKILDYGNNYVALKLYEDITRPEMSEFLLGRGWKMIGFATNKEPNKTYILEKWCNIRDH